MAAQKNFTKRLEEAERLLDKAATVLTEVNGEMQKRVGEASERWLASAAGKKYGETAHIVESAMYETESARHDISGVL